MRPLSSLLVSLLILGCAANRSYPDFRTKAPVSEQTRGTGSEQKGLDEPGAAGEYYAMKRAGANDPQARYAAARARIEEMPRYSSVSDHTMLSARQQRFALRTTSTASSNAWTFLGPGNIGGRTRTLIIDTDNLSVMYAGAVSGGVFKTTNGGERWEPVGDVLANLTVNSLVMDPRDHNVLYAGTGEGYFREEVRGTALPLRGDGIYATRDGGVSWHRLPSTATADFQWVNDLIISRFDSRRLYAATRTGVWRSNDAGESWKRVVETNVKGGCLDLAFRTDAGTDYMFVSCGTLDQASVYRTTDATIDTPWSVVLSEVNMGRTTLAIAPSQQSTIYALSASNEEGIIHNQALLAVFRSDQNGDPGTWTARVRNTDQVYLNTLLLTNPLPATARDCGGGRDSFITMGWYCNVIAVDPLDPERVWAAGVDLFRSDNGGATWGVASYWWGDAADKSFVHADQHSILFHPQYDGTGNQTMFATNDGGVFRTNNARAAVGLGTSATCDPDYSKVAFQALNHNYGATQFYHGAVFPDGRRFIAGAQDNGSVSGTIDDGIDSWVRQAGGDGGYVAIDPTNPRIVFAESQGANILKSIDGGASFIGASKGLNDDFLFITPFTMDPNNPRALWTGGTRLWHTTDGAANWSGASTMLDGRVSAIAVAAGRSERVIAGTSTGFIYRNDDAVTGTQWTSTRPREGFVSSAAFDPGNINVAYATYAGFGGAHVWKSIDGGSTWSSMDGTGNGALPDMPVHSIAVDVTHRDRLYLGTDLGVFVSNDAGGHWLVENTGFPPVVTESVAIAQGERGLAVYAFTHGRGAWRAELSPTERRRTIRR